VNENHGRVTLDDFDTVSALASESWIVGADRDWEAPAGTLEWSCLFTADHVIDCVFSYALFLGSRRLDDYPRFGELHALPGAGPTDMIDGLRAVTAMLSGVIATAPPETRAVLVSRARLAPGAPDDFAARGALELILHAHDIASGLDVPFDPPRAICARILHHTAHWPGNAAFTPTEDSWADLLARSGRPRPR
jgi:hypothetical protein